MHHRGRRPPTGQRGAVKDCRPLSRVIDSHVVTQENGSALISVMLLTAVLLALGAFASRSAQIELRIANNDMCAKKALSAADAGSNHAYALIRNAAGASYDDELSNDGTGGALAGLGALVSLDGVKYRFVSFGGATGDGYYVRVVDNYDEPTGPNDPTHDRDARIKIISRGRVGGAERLVETQAGATQLFPNALFGEDYVTLTGGSHVDSFDSGLGAYNPATARSNGDTRSDGTIELNGDGTMISGNATTVTQIVAKEGAITGARITSAPAWYPPSVPPCGPPYYPTTAGITTIGNAAYKPAQGTLEGKGGSTIVLADGSYCFRSINLTGGSVLMVNGPVKVYVTDFSDMGGGSILNTTGLASNFMFFSSYVKKDADGVKLAGGAGAYLSIYAPDTGVRFTGGTDFFGAVVGGYLTNNGGTNFHYDEALGSIHESSVVQQTGWREVRTL